MRKTHVQVPQEDYLRAIEELDAESPGFVVLIEDIAEHFDVSTTSAYHKLEGLAFQGKLQKTHPGYRLVKPLPAVPGTDIPDPM